jgi:hypothetical protein
MEITQDWSIEWVTFFDEYAGAFHQTFRLKLAKQLFENGSLETGIHGFDKCDFQLLIGQDDLNLQEVQGYMFGLVSFITPTAYSYPVWICWKAEGENLVTLHTKDVSSIGVEFHWGGKFPKEEILQHIKPYKRKKKDKSNLHFDIEYYHNAFPDIVFELFFGKDPEEKQIKEINNFLITFLNECKNTSKQINFLSPLTQQTDCVYTIVGDFGVHNSIKTVDILLKELSDIVQPDKISRIAVK